MKLIKRDSMKSGFGRFLVAMVPAALLFMAPTVQAAAGDSKATAVSITMKTAQQTKTVTLVDGKVEGYGVYYFKLSLKNGTGYSAWSTGTSSVSAYMGQWDASYEAVNKDFWAFTASDTVNFWMTVYPEDWPDASERPSGTYYLVVEGEVGESFTLNWVEGVVVEPEPEGTEVNPTPISVGLSEGSAPKKLNDDGSYYFKATLTAGQKYKFETKGGTEDNLGFLLSVYALGEIEDPVVLDGVPTDEYNASAIVLPAQTGAHAIVVSGASGAGFSLKYQVVAARLPAAHPAIVLGAPTTGGIVRDCGPFARNNPVSGFYDPVIDECLFKVSLVKDSSYVFETDGDEAPDGLVMEIYDAKGAVLQSNRGKAPGTRNTLIAFKAPATADYWVGVCQDVEEPAGEMSCTFTARKMVSDEQGLADDYDAADNTYAGSSGLAPVPGALTGSAIADGVAHGPHTLGLTDWADWFRIDARKDISYKVQAQVEEGWEAFTLAARIYTLSGTTTKFLQAIPDLTAGGELTATMNGSYYIEVYVRDGQGVEFGPYALYSLAYKAGTPLGMLQVNIGGPTAVDGGLWSLESDGASAAKYPGGSTVLLPAGNQTVKFSPVKNWTTPANVVAPVVAGTEPTVVTVNYNDTSDPKDDNAATATVLLPTNKEQKQSHSLWADDAADWFKVTVKSDTYYTFKLEPFTGLPLITVYRANQADVVAAGADLQFLARENATYYVKVAHADPAVPTDSAYTLIYLAQTVGVVKFEKAAYIVKEGVVSADVKVTRSAKDGRVRVRYTTQAGTALPGTDYKPVQGYLEWANADSATQTISVPLIPNLYQKWEDVKDFSVLIDVLPDQELEDDEFVPSLGTPSETLVTITEIAKKAPGKLGFGGYGPDADEVVSFADPKKPAVKVAAGDAVTFWVVRTDGGDGEVAVKAETVQGTALSDVGFESASELLTWAAGDLTPKPFTVRTLPTGELYQAEKAFTVKLTVDKASGGGATLGTAAVSVLVRDPQVDRTVEEWLASADKPEGVSAKSGVVGAWFFGAEGVLRSIPLAAKAKAEMTLTVTGPGTFTFAPELIKGVATDSSFVCTIGKDVFPCESGAVLVKYVPKGVQTVKCVVTRGAAALPDAEVYGRFNAVDGQPFQWVPLLAATMPLPSDKTVIAVGEDVTFTWDGAVDQSFRLYVADTVANLDKAPKITQYVVGNEFCVSCGAFPSFDAGKTYYWRVDAVIPGDPTEDRSKDWLTHTGANWSFSVAAANAPRTTLTDAATGAELVSGGTISLVQSVTAGFALGRAGGAAGTVTYSVIGGKLPDGLTLNAASGKVTGAPSKAGVYTVVLQAKVGAIGSTSVSVTFVVTPINLAAGTFGGLLYSDAVATNAHESLAQFSFSATEAGKLTAKATVAGKSYAFTAAGYSEDVELLGNGQPGVLSVMELKSVVAGVTRTNTVTVSVCRGAAADVEALDTLAQVDLVLWIPAANNLSARRVSYTGALVRDSSKILSVAEGVKKLSGYYTVSLPAQNSFEGAPDGAGYVTITVDAKGSVKGAGVLPDGTALSAAGVPGYVSDYNGSGEPALLLPIFYAKGLMAVGGWLVIQQDEVVAKPVATGGLDWFQSDVKATRDAEEGFNIWLEANGGFYDTLVSLQTYYLNCALNLGPFTAPETLDGTYTELLCTPETYGLTLSIIGDAITAPKRTLVKDASDVKLNDFEGSSNPCNVAFSFKRATGLFSGTFSLWYGNGAGTLQREKTGLKFQGVLTPLMASGSQYAASAGLGFYQIPQVIGARTWTGSYLFDIRADEVSENWEEGWSDQVSK